MYIITELQVVTYQGLHDSLWKVVTTQRWYYGITKTANNFMPFLWSRFQKINYHYFFQFLITKYWLITYTFV
jgi:hypothetical protein